MTQNVMDNGGMCNMDSRNPGHRMETQGHLTVTAFLSCFECTEHDKKLGFYNAFSITTQKRFYFFLRQQLNPLRKYMIPQLIKQLCNVTTDVRETAIYHCHRI